MPPRNLKTLTERQHAKRRAKERFNLKLNRKQLAIINSLIRNHHSIPIWRQSNRVSIYLIKYKGKQMKVAYDKIRKQVVTFMYAPTSVKHRRPLCAGGYETGATSDLARLV